MRVKEPLDSNIKIDSFWVNELITEEAAEVYFENQPNRSQPKRKQVLRGKLHKADLWLTQRQTSLTVLLSVYSLLTDNTNVSRSKIRCNRNIVDDTYRVSVSSDLTYDHYDDNDTVMISDYKNHAIHMHSVSKKQYVGLFPLVSSPGGLQFTSGLHYDSVQNIYTLHRVD